MTLVAIYARFSTEMQRDASIDDQIRLCQERADREGWHVVNTFTDRAISGATMLRPGLQNLIEGATAGLFDTILAEALDRLSRDQADIAALYKRLSFAGVQIVTLSEGEISELHVGLKGTMNQLFLKDLAAKTRRGLRGRVEAGFSGGGNSYGYDVIRRQGPDGALVTGERSICEEEAKVVQRVFREFSDGRSPRAIAHRLNADGISGPRGLLWRDTAIRGHRTRGTGLLNNELYIGRLVWNRLRYVKDPLTGRRVSRINPRESWIVTEVPALRIIDDALWASVKRRQEDIDAQPAVVAIKATRFWERRRPTHLLTGLLVCGHCHNRLTSVGKDYVACSAARKLRTCSQTKSFRRGVVESAVLDLVRNRLMQPDAVAEFVAAYSEELNARRGSETADRSRQQRERGQLARKLDGLYDAVADGLRTPGLKERLEEMERRLAQLDAALATPAPSPVRLHPNIGQVYRKKVTELSAALDNPDIRAPAIEAIRSLIEQVTISDGAAGATLDLEGAITAMVDLAQPLAGEVDHCSVKVVAGIGFEPMTFRL